MDLLKIEATKNTPEVSFNPISHIFEIKGKSHPENIKDFFTPVFSWLEKYCNEIRGEKNIAITFNFKYYYLNSSSFKHLIILLKKMNAFKEIGIPVAFNWYYEEDDEDMREAGKELFEFSETHMPVEFIPYNF